MLWADTLEAAIKLNTVLLGASFAVLLVSFWQRNDLPANIVVRPEVEREPMQSRTQKAPFDVIYKSTEYRIEPEYDYDIAGVVVSFRHHEGTSRMHARANDHLNMLDVCVVWGENAGNPALQAFDFWNGIFTCVFKTRSNAAWLAFEPEQLSNNHLVSDSDLVRNKVRDIAVGDQIRVRGYLTSYSNADGGRRGTSTTRKDTGDGACETIYVEQFDIIEPVLNPWRVSMYSSLALFLGGLVVHFRRPYRPH